MILYHLTGHQFEIGDIIVPQPDGYTHWEESNALESILEEYRPHNKLNRKKSVFLMKDKPSKEELNKFGAQDTTFLVKVKVDPDTINQSSDLSWIFPLDQGFNDPEILKNDYKKNELFSIAKNYWSGKYSKNPSIEYRFESALVLDIEEI